VGFGLAETGYAFVLEKHPKSPPSRLAELLRQKHPMGIGGMRWDH
jgi:hypothetical protein